jgi:hypothetical protein
MKRINVMNLRLFFWMFSLIAILGLSSCAPAVANSPAAPVNSLIPASATPATTAPVLTQPVQVQAVATSRGPNLEATDPATVSLASGHLQLVEFFRFT